MAVKDLIQKIFHPERSHRESGVRHSHHSAEEYKPFDRRRMHPLEGAGRSGWDQEQNRAYGSLYGNIYGPSSVVGRDHTKHFRGIGPRNYQRKDENIREDINDRLTDDHYVDATNIEVSVNNGEVVLSGYVEDRSAKRRAEDVAESVTGVRHLENRLKISKSS